MQDYDYKEGRKRINAILNSKTKIKESTSIPKYESEFTYENGISTWVGALFVDIRDSTVYFKENKSEHVARIMRAFCSEIITILNKNDNYRQIGIRGDCIYAIYSAPLQADLINILNDAIMINTFNKMFQKILENNNLKTFKIGIGLGVSKDLIVKAGKKGIGISDNIWIGDAVIDASKLSNQGNKYGFEPIVMDANFYDNIKDYKANKEYQYSHYFEKRKSNILYTNVYHGYMIYSDFNDWIDNGMR